MSLISSHAARDECHKAVQIKGGRDNAKPRRDLSVALQPGLGEPTLIRDSGRVMVEPRNLLAAYPLLIGQ